MGKKGWKRGKKRWEGEKREKKEKRKEKRKKKKEKRKKKKEKKKEKRKEPGVMSSSLERTGERVERARKEDPSDSTTSSFPNGELFRRDDQQQE